MTENSDHRRRRPTAGVNNDLNPDFTWPQGFGEASGRHEDPIQVVETTVDVHYNPENINQSDMNAASSKKSIRSVSTKHSIVSLDLERKILALETEKSRQALQAVEEEMKNKKKLLELENQVREAELVAKAAKLTSSQGNLSSRHSVTKSVYPEVIFTNNMSFPPSVTTERNTYVQNWIEDIPKNPNEQTFPDQEGDKNEPDKKSEMNILCETLNKLLQNSTNQRQSDLTNKLIARQTIERDFPIFDGRPEEWLTFYSQFKRISSLCDYSQEEKIIKLQKCLRGEAKYVVAGMMSIPENVDLVIDTLQMHFGRPDLIIEVLLSRVRNLSVLRDQNLTSLIYLSNHVRCLVSTVLSLNQECHLKNPQVLKELMEKLPESLRLRWGEQVAEKKGNVDLQDFSKWLSHIASAASYVSTAKTKANRSNFNPRRQESSFTTVMSTNNKRPCVYCKEEGHKIGFCPKIKKDDIDTRWKEVTRLKLCFSCLKSDHHTSKCTFRRMCGINGCRRPHNKFLHKDDNQNNQNSVTNDIQNQSQPTLISTEPSRQETLLSTQNRQKNILLRMIKVKLYGNDTSIETVALCDEASTVTLIDSTIVDALNLQGNKETLCLQWTNEITKEYEDSMNIKIKISGVFPNATVYQMNNVRSVNNLSLPYQKIDYNDWKNHPHLMNIPFDNIDQRPLILIGQDNIRLTIPRKISQGSANLPIATKTSLGWILHGVGKEEKREDYSFHICSEDISDETLHKMVKNSFSLDAFGISSTSKIMNNDDQRAVNIMKSTVRRIGDRFEIGLLWKSDDIVLPESRAMAFRRLFCAEKQMDRNQDFKNKYCDKVDEYVQKGYARKLSWEEAAVEGPRCWYLPHFGVVNSNKPGKLRLVFDGAAKSHGSSLNDHLLSGPDLLQSLVSILIKFRLRKVAFTSDVREMFHQVKIRQEDHDSQRFLWRGGDEKKTCDVYEMQVMTFGATCSPTCAQYIKNINAHQLTTDKRLLDAITKRHYVDDYLDCTDTDAEALEIIRQVNIIQKKAGFELVNWTSNSETVIQSLSRSEDTLKDLNYSDNTLQRILGLSWDSKCDHFIFRVKTNLHTKIDERPTKRMVLKTVMSVFDPLGLVVNFTIRGRILIQDIWRAGIGWDEVLDERTYNDWKLWCDDLSRMSDIQIPRCYSFNIPKSKNTALHIFCDSSKKAFSALAYLRIETDEDIDVILVFGKSRVAPTKPISIPRLELQAALMGARLAKTVKDDLELDIHEVCYWTDSTTVLYWIKSDATRLGQFESHRIGEIQDMTETSSWRWVPSKHNPADLATRTYNENGTNVIDFQEWFTGPPFLYQRDRTTWPTKEIDQFQEKSPTETILVVTRKPPENVLPEIERFSKWNRLIRSTAWVLRFIKIMRGDRQKIFPKELEVEEIMEAERKWTRQVQEECFSEEIRDLERKRDIKRQSKLFKLTPSLDKNGILVLNGRTNLAPDLNECTKNPAILPKYHRFTKLLVRNYHERFAHQGVELVLNELRQKYWIIDGRSVVKHEFAQCMKCRKWKAKPNTPQMGQLPLSRMTPNVKPFTYTGVDYFGPLSVTIGRRTEKRYGVIFTCLSIRAIHLEVAHSLSTESTIMAIRRLISRRGPIKQMFSDNGTNLRGAAEELKKAIQEINHQTIFQDMTLRGIDWKFIPPNSPHMGGSWERLIRCVKKSFQVVLNGQKLKDEILLTLFSEVEHMVNSRPITKVSTDPNDYEALTPNHFLIGTTGNEPLHQFDKVSFRSQWRKTQYLADSYWKRWIKEYLPSLTKRNKWCQDSSPLIVGDVVVIVDKNAPRQNWKLGRVERQFPGPDGRVRVVEVKTSTGLYKRPVTVLAKIDLREEDESPTRRGGM